MLNTKELLFIHDCAAQGINHHEFPKNETAGMLDQYLMQFALGEDYTFIEAMCRDFIEKEMAKRAKGGRPSR